MAGDRSRSDLKRPKRKPIPLHVKVDAALLALGLDPATVEWNHTPAIELRPVNDAGDDTVPPMNDPRYIVPVAHEEHKRITFGDPAVPLSGDLAKIAKTKRLEAKRLGTEKKRWKRPWPKRKFPKRIKP